MYIAIQVQTTREKIAIKQIERLLVDAGINHVNLHLFERTVTKLGQGLRTIKENIMPGYIVAEIKGIFSDAILHILNQSDYVVRILHGEIEAEEFLNLQEKAQDNIVQIREPKAVNYRKTNSMLSRLGRAMEKRDISKKVINRLKAYMTRIREQQRQYQAYIRHINMFSSYRVFTGRNYVLEFPFSALEEARKRLFGISFGWNDPAQLAIRLAISLE